MRKGSRRVPPAGFTLTELLLVVVIIGIVSLYVFPRAGRIYDRTMVAGARGVITNLYNATRATARASNHTMVLKRTGNVLVIEQNRFFPSTGKDTVGGLKNLFAQYGVTVTGQDSIQVDARGMLLSSATEYKWVITRDGYSDSVMVNAYGRIVR
jgi:prepilin-type N-terminal cleavage/methylation domain-containing protein